MKFFRGIFLCIFLYGDSFRVLLFVLTSWQPSNDNPHLYFMQGESIKVVN